MSDYPAGVYRVQAKDVKPRQRFATKMFGNWSYDRISSIGENGLGRVIIRRFNDTASDSFDPDTYVLVAD